MPLEPSEPGRPSRKLTREPGLSGLVPWLVGGMVLLGFVGFMGFCTAVSQFGDVEDLGSDQLERNLDVQRARLNAVSALKQGRVAQEQYHAEHGTYTTDFSVITEEGFWEDVTIEGVRADVAGYCMQAAYGQVDRYWHLSSQEGKARSGRCP